MKSSAVVLLLLLMLGLRLADNALWLSRDGAELYGSHCVWLENQTLDLRARLLEDLRSDSLRRAVQTSLERLRLNANGGELDYTYFSPACLVPALLLCFAPGPAGFFWLSALGLFLPFALALLLLFLLAKTLHGARAGLWAAGLFSCYPGLIGLSRKTNSDLYTSVCVLGLFLLAAHWKNIGRIFWSLLLAALSCAGFLCGPVFFAYFLPFLFVHGFYTVKADSVPFRRAAALAGALMLCAAFWSWLDAGDHAGVLRQSSTFISEAWDKLTFRSNSFVGSAKEGQIESYLVAPQEAVCPCTQTANAGFNLRTVGFYAVQLAYYASLPLLLLAFGAGLWLFFRRRNLSGAERAFWSQAGLLCAGAYLLLTFSHIKWGKFCAPLLPVCALASGALLAGAAFRGKTVLRIVCALLALGAAVYGSFLRSPGPQINETLFEGITAHRPVPSPMPEAARAVASALEHECRNGKTSPRLVLLDKESLRFMGGWVTDRSMRAGYLVRAAAKPDWSFSAHWSLSEDFFSALAKADALLIIAPAPIQNIGEYLFAGRPAENRETGIQLIESKPLGKDSPVMSLYKIAPLPPEGRSSAK